jgi:hypothetical protein
LASPEPAALLEQAGPGRPVDGAVDAAAPEKARVGGVHDGIDRQRGDVRTRHVERKGAAHPRNPLRDRHLWWKITSM